MHMIITMENKGDDKMKKNIQLFLYIVSLLLVCLGVTPIIFLGVSETGMTMIFLFIVMSGALLFYYVGYIGQITSEYSIGRLDIIQKEGMIFLIFGILGVLLTFYIHQKNLFIMFESYEFIISVFVLILGLITLLKIKIIQKKNLSK